jgi:hypothetical protein
MLVFAFGVLAIVTALAIAIEIPRPEPYQQKMFAVFAALGAASVCSGFTGMLEIETRWLKAGGSLGVFVLVIWVILGGAPEIFGHA